MEQNKEYFVFISYSSLDNEWAIWLRHELEHYHLPASFNWRTDVRDNLREVFRDRDELSAGPEWDKQVQKALEDTNNLIVICSPHSAKSDAVNKEIETFIALGKEDQIFPFIVEGDKPEDCFPPALRHSKLGGDVNKDGGRDSAFIKIVAGMLKVSFSSLWNRYEREKAEEERKMREQRDNLLRVQSRFLAEKANALIKEGDFYTARLLALVALPKNMQNPDRPYVAEAEQVLRNANQYDRMVIKHPYSVSFATFSPDNKIIATASNDFSIYLWDAKTGKLIRKLEGNIDFVNYLSFSPNGEMLVSSSGHIWSRAYSDIPMDFSIRIWNVKTGEEIRKLEGHSRKVKNACFCNNEKWIISASSDNTVRIWEVSTGKELERFDNLTTLESTSGLFLLKHVDSALIFWRPEAPMEKMKICWHEEETPRLLSPKTNIVVSTYFNHTEGNESINIWDVNTSEKIMSFEGHTGSVKSLSLSSDGKQLISTSTDKTIRIWDITKGKEIKCFNISSWVEFACFSNDGISIVYNNDSNVCFRSLTNNYELGRINSGTINTDSISFSPDGEKFIVAAGRNLKIFDVNSKEEVLRIKGYKCRASIAVFSPNGKWIVASLIDQTIRIWDAITGKEMQTINESGIFSFAFINDVQVLIVMLYKSIHIWDLENNKLILNIEKPSINNISMAVHTKSFLIAATQRESHQILFWDIRTGKEINSIIVDFYFAQAISFHPNGKLIACASSNYLIHVLDVKTGKEYRKLEGHTGYVNSIAFSNDGNYILSSSDDKTIRIWDIESSKEIMQLMGHSNFVTDVSFNPQNDMIASVSNDESIRFWSFISLQELIDKTRERFEDNPLTSEERKKYFLD